MPNYYEILEIEHTANTAAIKSAYHRLAQLYHPDKIDTGDVDKYNKIQKAFNSLSNHERRQKYDKSLLNPDDTQLVVNIPELASHSSSSTALVPVTSFNLSELIVMGALPAATLKANLQISENLAIQAWKSDCIRTALTLGDWIELAEDFYRKNQPSLMKLILTTLHTQKIPQNKWPRFYLLSSAKLHIEIFSMMVDLKIADIFTGLDFNKIRLVYNNDENSAAVFAKNEIYRARYNAFNRIARLKSLRDTTIEAFKNDIKTALFSHYEPELLDYLSFDDELLILFFKNAPSACSSIGLDWVRKAQSRNSTALAECIADSEEITQWTPNVIAALANISAPIYLKLLQRRLLNQCDDIDIAKFHNKYPNVVIEDESLKQKLKRAAFLSNPEAQTGMTPQEIAATLNEMIANHKYIDRILQRQTSAVAIEAIKIESLFKKIYLYQWIDLASNKIDFALQLAASPLFHQHYALTSAYITAVALTQLETAQLLLQNDSAKRLNGGDLQLILDRYGDKIYQAIVAHPEMTQKLYANYQAGLAFKNMHIASLAPAPAEQAADDDMNDIYKLAVVNKDINLFKLSVKRYRHKASFAAVLNTGKVKDLQFCYKYFGNDPDLNDLKLLYRKKLYELTQQKRYQSEEQKAAEALAKEQHNLAASIQCMYIRLRRDASFTFFRTNYFSTYKDFQTIADYARLRPRSRTALCVEVITQIDIFMKARLSGGLVKKIQLSEFVLNEIKDNSAFNTFLTQQYPDFMQALLTPSAATSEVLPSLSKLIADRNITNSIEGNPTIINSML